MKLLTDKAKKILNTGKGEALMEAIVSVMLLSILLTTVTTMIMTSRRITANTMVEARRVQEDILNDVFVGDAITSSTPGFNPGFDVVTDGITFWSPHFDTENGTNMISFDIRIFDDDNDPNIPPDIVSFFPVAPTPPGP